MAALITLCTAGTASSSVPKSGCTHTQTTTTITRFLNAFNRGDQNVLNNRVWGGRLYFNWYAVTTDPGSRVDPDARRRDTLMRYFATRHAADERLVLTQLKINSVSASGYRNFEFHLLRRATDLAGGETPYLGKGAVSCATGRLITWVVGAGS